jgi:enoyl-CoA hydratase
MWAFKCGVAHAKRVLLTGDLLTADDAYRIGVATAVARDRRELDDVVGRLAARMTSMPLNQLAMQKLVLNQVLHNQVRNGCCR